MNLILSITAAECRLLLPINAAATILDLPAPVHLLK